MTNEEAIKMLKAKLYCMTRETSGTEKDCNEQNCDNCPYNYEQGNMGEQKEALKAAIKALEQQNELFKKGATNKDVFKAVFGYEPATNDVVCNKEDWCGASEPCNYCICNPDKVGIEEDWWNAPYKTESEVTAITHYEAIKGMNEDALATFIMHLETGMCAIPKKYYCDETYCVNCKDHLSCYKNYLKSEVSDK